MKILTFLVITLFSCMTAHAAERKWRSLAGVMYLDENSVVVTNERGGSGNLNNTYK